MSLEKKKLSKKFQKEADEIEKEKNFFDLSERASKGDLKAMVSLLAKSDRGYEMNDSALEDILKKLS
jgi:hypothetical protein